MGRYARLLQLQVAVPGQRHENVAADEQQDGVDCVHVYVFFRAQSYENKSLLVPHGRKKEVEAASCVICNKVISNKVVTKRENHYLRDGLNRG